MVHDWRNHESVARHMYRDSMIPFDEHSRWFSQVLADSPSSRYRVFEADGNPIGWMSLTRIDMGTQSCEWGGYLAPDCPRGRGLGRAMMALSLDLAIVEMGLNRVVVEVLVENSPAIRLYESIGFVLEGRLRERAKQSNGVKDAFLYSVLSSEWLSNRSATWSMIEPNSPNVE